MKRDFKTKKYSPVEIPEDRDIALYTEDMTLPINCINCGARNTFGDCYTSQRYHTPIGLGYPVCEKCYAAETKLRLQYGKE